MQETNLRQRLEDERLLCGKANFIDDMHLPNQLYGCVLRSAVAHANLQELDTHKALRSPGVAAILTGMDVQRDGLGGLPNIIRRRRRDGSPMVQPFYPILAQQRIRHVGEALAFIVAETPQQALDASELIGVHYEEIPAVSDCGDALARAAPLIWQDVAGNEAFFHEVGDRFSVEAAFGRAVHRVCTTMLVPRVASCAMEPRGAIGAYDETAGIWCLYASVQKPHLLRGLLASVFRVPEDMIGVVAPHVGGSFGTKGLLHPELVLVLWAARRIRRPVKWISTRSDAFLSDYHGRDNKTIAELALDAEGRFLALRTRTIANLGAYLSSYGTHSSTNNLLGLLGVYATPAFHAEIVGAYTNTVPTGPYRGAGRPEASYVIERLIDVAARQTGFDRLHLRKMNLIPPEHMPFRTALGFTYDDGNFARNMDRALILIGWDGFPYRRELAKSKGLLRGIGVANCLEIAGPADFDERAEVQIDVSGSVKLIVGTDSHGQGHETVFTSLASELLGIGTHAISVVSADTRAVTRAHGSFGSRSACVGGSALLLAIQDVIEKGRAIASELAGVPAAHVAFTDGRFVADGRLIDWLDIVERTSTLLVGQGRFAPSSPTFPNGCHACEVEIDPDDGTVTILNYVVVDDVGRVLHPAIVEGQLHGGIAQGIGEVMQEAVRYDHITSQMLSGSLMDYSVPRAADLPPFLTETCPVPTSINPLGVKGVGEAGIVGALPAVANAVCDALAPLGIDHVDMPLTPENVWAAIQRVAHTAGGALMRP